MKTVEEVVRETAEMESCPWCLLTFLAAVVIVLTLAYYTVFGEASQAGFVILPVSVLRRGRKCAGTDRVDSSRLDVGHLIAMGSMTPPEQKPSVLRSLVDWLRSRRCDLSI